MFGYWGIYTPYGRTQFAEMDGTYPMLDVAAGVLALLLAIVVAIISRIRSTNRARSER
jgi:hypothetical protein